MNSQLNPMKAALQTAVQSLDPRDPGDRAARLILVRASFLLAKPIDHNVLCDDLRDYTDPENGFLGELRPDLVGQPLGAASFFEPEAVQAGLNRLRQLNWLEPVADLPGYSSPNQFLRPCRPTVDPEMLDRELSAITLNVLDKAETAYNREELSLLDGLIYHLSHLAEYYKSSMHQFSPYLSLYYGWAVGFYGQYELALEHLSLAEAKGRELFDPAELFSVIAFGQYLLTLGSSGQGAEAAAKFVPFLASLPQGPYGQLVKAPELARIWRNAGAIARAVNDLGRAEQYLRKSLEGLQEYYGPNHERTGLSEALLVLVLAEGSHLEAAEPHLQAALQTISSHRNHPHAGVMGLQVGQALVLLKRYAEAKKVLSEARDSLFVHYGPEDSFIEEIEVLLRVIAEATRPRVEKVPPKAGWFQRLGWFQRS